MATLDGIIDTDFLNALNSGMSDCECGYKPGDEFWKPPHDAVRVVMRLLLERDIKDPYGYSAEEILTAFREADLESFRFVNELVSDDESCFMFIEYWREIRTPYRKSPISMAFFNWHRFDHRASIELGLPTRKTQTVGNCLASIAGYLAANNKDGIFFLNGKSVADLLEPFGVTISSRSVSRIIRRFVDQGYFEIYEKHIPGSRATRYELTYKFESVMPAHKTSRSREQKWDPMR